MLVLTRKTDETIVIGEDVEVMVIKVSGDKVRLGISAPRSLAVYRKEAEGRSTNDAEGDSSTKAA